VLLTHGHLDHVYSVTPVCGAGDTAAYIHSDDRYRLPTPLGTLEPQLLAMLEPQFGARVRWREPDDVVELTDRDLHLAGLERRVQHAPGHTEGSVMFGLDGVPDGDRATSGPATAPVISGDVLFAGSIGRTDLPGGSTTAMTRSLRDVVLPLPDDTLVLPATARPPRCAESGPPTPTCKDLAP
jgi:hydroxyacylglutathione hydrolase